MKNNKKILSGIAEWRRMVDYAATIKVELGQHADSIDRLTRILTEIEERAKELEEERYGTTRRDRSANQV